MEIFFAPLLDSTYWFDVVELASFLPDVDPDRYLEAMHRTLGQTAAEIKSAHLESWVSKTSPSGLSPEVEQYIQTREAEVAKEIELANWLENELKPLRSMEERARARLFIKLSDGSIPAWGFVEREDEAQNQTIVELIEIPRESWILDKTDWRLASTFVDGKRAIGAHLAFDELLKCFPKPHFTPVQLTAERYGSTVPIPVAASEGPGALPIRTKKPRGRPQIGDGLVRTAIRNEFRTRKSRGDLASKKEANIQAAIEWAERILETDVARTSVQRWLDGII